MKETDLRLYMTQSLQQLNGESALKTTAGNNSFRP